jgi:hypothetical protein
MFRFLIISILLVFSACVPKPEEIKGCGSGLEFNNDTLSCVSANPAINLGGSLLTLSVDEDTPESFSLPPATTNAIGGDLYWFITTAPTKGIITGCADRTVTGSSTGVGTSLLSCVYTPNPNFVGADSFKFKICNSENGFSRCGAIQEVAVTISELGEDIPVLFGPSNITIFEGENISFDIRAGKRSLGESDSIHICMTLVDPTGALVPAGVGELTMNRNSAPFTTTLAGGCQEIGTENGNLNLTLSTVTASSNLIMGCPNNDPACAKVATIQLRMCEVPDCSILVDPNLYAQSTITVTVNPRNFAPVIAPYMPITATLPLVVGSILEEGAPITIGVDGLGAYNRTVLRATDLDDGQALVYEYIPGSYTPALGGNLVCPGNVLPCTFTPATNYNGPVSFRYLARDTAGITSTPITVNFELTAVNDLPTFSITSQVYAYTDPLTPAVLSESTTLANRTFGVGEGGGTYENSQQLTLSAVSTRPELLPIGNIALYRGTTLVGNLGSPLTIDAPGIDADLQNYNLSFTPVAGVVSNLDFTVTLTLNDAQATNNTSSIILNFDGITNINNPPSFTQAPPANFAFQQGGPVKDLVFRATPGTNDWANAASGLQPIIVTVTSSDTSVIDLSTADLLISGGFNINAPVCGAASCTWEIEPLGADDPADNDLTLQIEPGIRGTSNLVFTVSDGTGSGDVSSTTTVNVLNYVASFGGWNKVKALGPQYGLINTAITPATLELGWESLVVTENGTPVTDYTIKIFRNTTGNFAALDEDSDALDNAGQAHSINTISLSSADTFDDGLLLESGRRYYYLIAVVPNDTGDLVIPTATADQRLEVVMPPDNTVLVHRWMANRQFCLESGQTPDRTNNYRCLNGGLGAAPSGGNWYYDQLVHIYIDRYENGCPYDPGFAEDGLTASFAVPNRVHYNRSTGVCSYSTGAAWVPFDSTIIGNRPTLSTQMAEAPPLTNLNRSVAQAICAVETPKCSKLGCDALWAGQVRQLPIRREIIAASAWPDTFPVGTSRTVIEDNGDHGVGACNTSGAAGQGFVNFASTTATSSSFPSDGSDVDFRALLNSATVTANCESRYGVRNAVGNVSEWIADTFSCAQVNPAVDASCSLIAPLGIVGAGRDDSLAINNSMNLNYLLTDPPVRGNGVLIEMDNPKSMISYLNLTMDRIHMAVGFPFYESLAVFTIPGAPKVDTSTTFPATIESAYYGQDTLALYYGSDTTGDPNTRYAAIQGGHWESGNGAGRFSLELVQQVASDNLVGHRCVVRLTPSPAP